MMTSNSFNPDFSLISSKVIQSAQAAQITQLSEPSIGLVFFMLVTGLRYFFFTTITSIPHYFQAHNWFSQARSY